MTPRPTPRPTKSQIAEATDPFVTADPGANPGPTRAAAAVKSAEQPLMARAADYAPAGDTLYLKDVAGHEVTIHNIAPGTDSYGDCVDLLVIVDGEEEPICVHVSGFLAGRLIGLRNRIEAGECAYPLAARFEKLQIKGGKTVWSMQ